jgi:hypothetical protein
MSVASVIIIRIPDLLYEFPEAPIELRVIPGIHLYLSVIYTKPETNNN